MLSFVQLGHIIVLLIRKFSSKQTF